MYLSTQMYLLPAEGLRSRVLGKAVKTTRLFFPKDYLTNFQQSPVYNFD